MIPNLNSIITILIITTPILLLIMFLPALVELKKPKDEGPRMIMENPLELGVTSNHIFPMANIEENRKFDRSLIQTLSKIIEVLPSLEV